MYALKQLIVVPILAAMLGSASLLAQITDSFSSSNQVTNTMNSNATTQTDGSQYYWIGGVLFILIVFGVGYAVRSKRKKSDDPHLSGDSINNPASGI